MYTRNSALLWLWLNWTPDARRQYMYDVWIFMNSTSKSYGSLQLHQRRKYLTWEQGRGLVPRVSDCDLSSPPPPTFRNSCFWPLVSVVAPPFYCLNWPGQSSLTLSSESSTTQRSRNIVLITTVIGNISEQVSEIVDQYGWQRTFQQVTNNLIK